MSKLGLDRTILAGITQNHQAIVALERVFKDVGTVLPEAIEAALNQALQAVAAVNSAFTRIVELSDIVDQLSTAPATADPADEEDFSPAHAHPGDVDDLTPAVQLGTVSSQDADNIMITGGTIGLFAGTLAEPSFYLVDRKTGFYRIALNKWGMAIDGVKLADFSSLLFAITGELKTTRSATIGNGTLPTETLTVGSSSGTGGGAQSAVRNGATVITAMGNKSALLGGGYDATPMLYFGGDLAFSSGGSDVGRCFSSGGRWFFGGTPVDDGVSTVYANGSIKAATTMQALGAFGCNGRPPASTYALPGPATDLASVILLSNHLRTMADTFGFGA